MCNQRCNNSELRKQQLTEIPQYLSSTSGNKGSTTVETVLFALRMKPLLVQPPDQKLTDFFSSDNRYTFHHNHLFYPTLEKEKKHNTKPTTTKSKKHTPHTPPYIWKTKKVHIFQCYFPLQDF